MQNVVVLDYGAGNLRSVAKALEVVADRDANVTVSNTLQHILEADKIVFPGQGAIGQCMHRLAEQELDQVIRECVGSKPFLGLCLGLQALLDYSEEDGGTSGLGLISGQILRFQPSGGGEKIPHMGWSRVYQYRTHPLWQGIPDGAYFYFAHSYYAQLTTKDYLIGHSHYICDYAAAVAKENVFAMQFHPEKSQQVGLQLLKNFLDW